MCLAESATYVIGTYPGEFASRRDASRIARGKPRREAIGATPGEHLEYPDPEGGAAGLPCRLHLALFRGFTCRTLQCNPWEVTTMSAPGHGRSAP